jgi:hypothetical protein
LIGHRRLGEAAQLPHELQGREINFLIRCRRVEVVKRLDVAAHDCSHSTGLHCGKRGTWVRARQAGPSHELDPGLAARL